MADLSSGKGKVSLQPPRGSKPKELGQLINGVVRRLIRASWREIRGTKGFWEQQSERWGHGRGQRANNELERGGAAGISSRSKAERI